MTTTTTHWQCATFPPQQHAVQTEPLAMSCIAALCDHKPHVCPRQMLWCPCNQSLAGRVMLWLWTPYSLGKLLAPHDVCLWRTPDYGLGECVLRVLFCWSCACAGRCWKASGSEWHSGQNMQIYAEHMGGDHEKLQDNVKQVCKKTQHGFGTAAGMQSFSTTNGNFAWCLTGRAVRNGCPPWTHGAAQVPAS